MLEKKRIEDRPLGNYNFKGLMEDEEAVNTIQTEQTRK